MADLTGLSIEELEAKLTELTDKVSTLNGQEDVADLSAWMGEIEEAIAGVEAVEAELATRKEVAEKADALKAKAAEIADAKEAAAKAEEEKAAKEAEEAKAQEEEDARIKAEEEAKAAEAKAQEEAEGQTISPAKADVPDELKPQAKDDEIVGDELEVATLVASADVPGVQAGEILSMKRLGKALFDRRNHIKNGGNNGEFVLVASAEANYPEDRQLTGNWEVDQEKVQNVTGTDVIVASGGICAPTEAYYKLEVLSESCRPVRDALVGFGVTRGGIRFMAPPSISQLVDSARITTEAQDAAGYNVDGDHSSLVDPKPSVHVSCGQITEVVVDAISSIITVGNLNARTYPELVSAWTQLAAAQHAKIAEVNLLDKISAASTAVTDAKAYGATGSLLGTLDKAIAGFKSRHRICTGVNLRAMFPEWVKNLLRTDLARQNPGDGLGHFAVSDAELISWFTARGVTVSFYKDSRTSAGMSYGAQSAGAITDYPSTIEWYLWKEGTFLFLDGGELNLGLVRDSTLNSTNDYSLFVETFENLAFVGHEALRITNTLQPDGSGPATQTVVTT